MSIEHEHVAIVEEGESESGWEREDETHGGCCIHVLHADLILTITVLARVLISFTGKGTLCLVVPG